MGGEEKRTARSLRVREPASYKKKKKKKKNEVKMSLRGFPLTFTPKKT
jgi:hypothetical protein